MVLSVFTPTHDPRFLDDCLAALLAQTHAEWEWIVLLNGGAPDWQPAQPDERVKVSRDAESHGVGAVKRVACSLAAGEVLVELDHDDILLPDALAEIAAAFALNPGATLVYSDWAQINEDGSPNFDRFDLNMGWVYSDEPHAGQTYLRCHALAAYPHNIGYIWYAPNHVRAFRRSSYEAVGGYNRALNVLDDQEIMMRLFLAGDFVHVDRMLYLQRMHGKNTQVEPATNAFIQEQTVRYYEENIEALALAWARRRGLEVFTLRTATSPEPVDPDPGNVLEIDPYAPRLPIVDGQAAVIKAPELLQRIAARPQFFNACHGALTHGGLLLTQTPSTDGRGAFQDPSHVSFWNENSFWYVTQAQHAGSMPELRARYMVSHIRTHFPTDWHQQLNIPYVEANLLAVKDGPRQGGPLLW